MRKTQHKSFNLPHSSRLPFGIAVTIFISIILLIALAVFAISTFSAAPSYPDTGEIVEEQSFAEYVGLVNTAIQFLTTIIGVLITSLLLMIILLGAQMYLWRKDRQRLDKWQSMGLVIERLEFLSGNRLRINSTEIQLNRAQYTTFNELINSRLKGETLHPSELTGDNGTQMIKRLREEMGGRIIEKTLIKSRRGKGYWAEIDPDNVIFREK